MNLNHISSVTIVLVLFSVSGVKSATVTLSTSSEKGQLGNYSVSLFCNYTLSSEERFFFMNFFRKRALETTLIKIISFYEDNVFNATYFNEASDLKGRTVLANPLASKRSAMLQYDSIQCADEADYRCELQYVQSGIQYVTSSDSTLLVTERGVEATLNKIISFCKDNVDNATYYNEGSDLKKRTVLVNPLASKRSAMLHFDSIQCADEADYRCELQYAQSGIQNCANSDSTLVVTATPMFGNQSILYTPSINLAENQTVTFTCIGNVGREPQGTFSWYKYVGGQPSGMVITSGINPVSISSVAGSCTYVRTENLILNLTKEDNQVVIRCTVQQTTMTELGDGNIQTDRISVYYAPRISNIGSVPIVSDPYNPNYSEGLAGLNLTCNADSNPPSNYVWTLPDGTMQTGYQLHLPSLTTNHTGWYTCMAYTGWGGQNYTASKSIKITVVNTTSPPPIYTTTATRSYASLPVTENPGTSTNIDSPAQTVNREKERISYTLFAILFGVVLGVSVVLVTILSICLHKQRMLASDLKHQLKNRSNTYDGLKMRVATSEPYTELNVEPSEDCHQSSAYLNLYERLHSTLESSEPYDILEGRL